MPVEKLPAVVAAEAQDRKCQSLLYFGNSLMHSMLALVPDRPGFRPLGVDISQGEAPAEASFH